MHAEPAETPERDYVIAPPPGQDVLENGGAVFGYPEGTVLAVRDRPGIARVVFEAERTGPGEGEEPARDGTRGSVGQTAVWQIEIGSSEYPRGAFAKTFDVSGQLLGEVSFPGFVALEPGKLRLYAPYLIREITPHYYAWKTELMKAVRDAAVPADAPPVPARHWRHAERQRPEIDHRVHYYGPPGYVDDLDGDGLPEIVMTTEHPTSPGERYIRILTVLDGDGHFEKRAGVRGVSQWSGFAVGIIPPADLDGDGVKELIVWVGSDRNAGPGRPPLHDAVFAIDFHDRLLRPLTRIDAVGTMSDAVFESGAGPNCVEDCPYGPFSISIRTMTADLEHAGARSELVHSTQIERFSTDSSQSDCVLDVYRKQGDLLVYDVIQSRTIPTAPGSTCEFAVQCLAGTAPPDTAWACPGRSAAETTR